MLKSYEGNIPYMYLDSRGCVTVGVGFLLISADDAVNYSFVLNTSLAAPQKATAAQIKAEWTSMKAQSPNHLESYYQRFTTMKMLQFDIDMTLTQKVNNFEAKARQTFVGWDDFASHAQLALLDMIYNLGSLAAFPTLTKFAAAKDWKNAAAQCHREGPSDFRNNATRDRFLAAAKEQPLS